MASTHRRDRRIPVSSTVQIHALANQMASQDLWTRKCDMAGGPTVHQPLVHQPCTWLVASHVHGWWPAMYMYWPSHGPSHGPGPAMVQAWSRTWPRPRSMAQAPNTPILGYLGHPGQAWASPEQAWTNMHYIHT